MFEWVRFAVGLWAVGGLEGIIVRNKLQTTVFGW